MLRRRPVAQRGLHFRRDADPRIYNDGAGATEMLPHVLDKRGWTVADRMPCMHAREPSPTQCTPVSQLHLTYSTLMTFGLLATYHIDHTYTVR